VGREAGLQNLAVVAVIVCDENSRRRSHDENLKSQLSTETLLSWPEAGGD
jgi:hypothetical protein